MPTSDSGVDLSFDLESGDPDNRKRSAPHESSERGCRFAVTHGVAMCHAWRTRSAHGVRALRTHLGEAREQSGKSSAAESSVKAPTNATRAASSESGEKVLHSGWLDLADMR